MTNIHGQTARELAARNGETALSLALAGSLARDPDGGGLDALKAYLHYREREQQVSLPQMFSQMPPP